MDTANWTNPPQMPAEGLFIDNLLFQLEADEMREEGFYSRHCVVKRSNDFEELCKFIRWTQEHTVSWNQGTVYPLMSRWIIRRVLDGVILAEWRRYKHDYIPF